VLVQRRRLDAERLGDRAERERLDAVPGKQRAVATISSWRFDNTLTLAAMRQKPRDTMGRACAAMKP
jgi:hypothetical protein